MKYFVKNTDRIVRIGAVIGASIMAVIALLITANVIVRLLGSVILGSTEIVGFLIVFSVAFAIGYTALEEGHVSVSILPSRLSQRNKGILKMVSSAVGLVCVSLMVWANIPITLKRFASGEESFVLGIPYFPARMILIYGLVLFCLVFLINIYKGYKMMTEVKK
jgi:TRAP-type C4-dicarboxylate transport system permease small subunit